MNTALAITAHVATRRSRTSILPSRLVVKCSPARMSFMLWPPRPIE